MTTELLFEMFESGRLAGSRGRAWPDQVRLTSLSAHSLHLAPLAGRGRRALARRVRGTLQEFSSWRLPLTPTLSPQAGRGSAPAAWRTLHSAAQIRTSDCP